MDTRGSQMEDSRARKFDKGSKDFSGRNPQMEKVTSGFSGKRNKYRSSLLPQNM